MDLPKNITQIGEINHSCRVYVEDYVISYIKQVNVHARDKTMAVAMYGTRKEEAGVTYLFFYGACRLNFLTRESRHLSQAVLQEAEESRQKYFVQYEFLGYCMLNGEMVEGFQICQQGVCRYISGYAHFYEKNDSMLAFMLQDRKEEAKPEEVNQEKYDEVKKRQEERRLQSREQGEPGLLRLRRKADDKSGAKRLRNMQYAAAAVFVLLCAAGMTGLGGGLSDLQGAAMQVWESMGAKQLPDAEEQDNKSVLVVTDDLEDQVYRESMAGMAGPGAQTVGSGSVTVPTGEPDISTAESPSPSAEPVAEPSESPSPDTTFTAAPATESTAAPAVTSTAAPASYTVEKDDTLIGICLKIYGSADKVQEVCNLNNIPDPDDIKAGQKILLP